MKKLTQQEWINKAQLLHKNKYDYSLVHYTNSREKIKIICPIHGEFEQNAASHLRGTGCKQCGEIQCAETHTKTLQTFIDNSNKVHDNRYDYSKVIYTKSSDKVIIICPIHGEFEQTANSHLTGSGCSKCSNKYSYNTEEWIIKANFVHKYLYNYDKVHYSNANTKVIITCPIHGDFSQKPSDHVNGNRGCPLCASSKGELLIYNWLKRNNVTFKREFELIISEIAKNSTKVRIDFFIKINNAQYFIEYDGIQHFKYTPYFHKNGIKDFERQQRRDKVLNDFCELHKDKVVLIRFNYKQNEKEIINKLNDEFKI